MSGRGVTLALALLGLASCGQKGPLYLPDPAPQVVPAAPAPAADRDPAKDPAKDKDKPDSAPNPTPAPPAPAR